MAPWNIDLPDAEWYTRDDPDLPCLVKEVTEDVPILAIDTETTGLNIAKDVPLFWSLSWGNRRICMPADTMLFFKQAFDDPNKKWVLANAKFDQHIMANVGCELKGELHDVQVMHALLYEEQPHGLKYITETILGWVWNDFKDTFRFNKAGKLTLNSTIEEVRKGGAFPTVQDAIMWCARNDLPKLIEYASNDAYGTMQDYWELKKQLEAANIYSLYPDRYRTLWDYFYKIEMPFTRVLWHCERNGIRVDKDYLDTTEKPVREELDRIGREINKAAGRVINPNSTPDLRKFFFTECKIKSRKLTKGGKSGVQQASLDSEVLEELSGEHPVAKLVLQYRELDKLMGTYIKGLAQHMDERGRIHTRFNQDVARTGRLSSADPNLQNIPNPENDNFKIRRAFIPEDGHDMIVADYDTLEMRLLACASLEPSMIEMIKAGRDIHMGNATLVFGHIDGFTYDEIAEAKKMKKKADNGEIPREQITERMHHLLRRRIEIKAVGFGLNYGMKERKLARELGISVDDAAAIIDAYINTYPAVAAFFDEAVNEARECGYAWTILGRRRFLPHILSDNEMDRWADERKAVNTPIQGTAADVVKMGMLRLHYEGELERRFGCKMLLQVHDELVFECPKENTEAVKPIIREMMEHPLPTDLAVPLTISMGVGRNWSEAH